MPRLILVVLVVAGLAAAAGVEQRDGVAKDEVLLAELQHALAKAWMRSDRATIDRIKVTGRDGCCANVQLVPERVEGLALTPVRRSLDRRGMSFPRH